MTREEFLPTAMKLAVIYPFSTEEVMSVFETIKAFYPNLLTDYHVKCPKEIVEAVCITAMSMGLSPLITLAFLHKYLKESEQ